MGGDLLAERRTSIFGCLSVGHNILLGYVLWDGVNFEDGVDATKVWMIDETFTSVHREDWEIYTNTQSRSIRSFNNFVENTIRNSFLRTYTIFSVSKYPFLKNVQKKSQNHCLFSSAALDAYGLIKAGRWVERGDIVVLGLKTYDFPKKDRLFFDIIEKSPALNSAAVSLCVPSGVMGRVLQVQTNKTIGKTLKTISTYLVNNKFMHSPGVTAPNIFTRLKTINLGTAVSISTFVVTRGTKEKRFALFSTQPLISLTK